MNLWLMWSAVRRHKVLMSVGLICGVLLAAISVFSPKFVPARGGEGPRFEFERRNLSVYSMTAAVLIDVPEHGLVRTDLPIDQNSRLAPAFAYLATSGNVVERVEAETGPLKDKVEVVAQPVEGSPVVQIVATGGDPRLVAKVAPAYARALSEYVTDYQQDNEVAQDVGVVLRPVRISGAPEEVQSRLVEVAVLMFLLPIAAAMSAALAIDNFRRGAATGNAAAANAQGASDEKGPRANGVEGIPTQRRVGLTPVSEEPAGDSPKTIAG